MASRWFLTVSLPWLVRGFLLLLVVAITPLPSWAAGGTVSGVLIGSDGQPLGNVAIEVRDEAGNAVAAGSTDAEGKYSVTSDDIKPGVTYWVFVGEERFRVVAFALTGQLVKTLIGVGVGAAGAAAAGSAIEGAVGGEDKSSLAQ